MSDTITLSRAEYEDLVDARDHAVAMQAVASSAMETLSETELDKYLAAPSPIAYWRKRRGYTQAGIAEVVGASQPFIAQIEHGTRTGDIHLYARLAKAFRVRVEDLIED